MTGDGAGPARPPRVASGAVRSALGATAAVLIWSGYYLVARSGLEIDLTVADLVAARYFVPGLVLAPLLLRLGVSRRGIAGIEWKRALVLTAVGGLTFGWLLTSGLRFAPASHGAIFTSATVPIIVVFLAWPILREAPTPGQLAGIALIFAGDVLIVADSWAGAGAAEGQYIGHLLMIGAGAAWASFTVLVRRWSVAPMPATIVLSVLSSVAFLPYYLLVAESNVATAPLMEMSVHFLYLGLLVGVGATLFYTAAVRVLGAQRTALTTALIPACTALLAISVLGENPTGMEIGGLVLVTSGMPFALGLRPWRRVAASPDQASRH